MVICSLHFLNTGFKPDENQIRDHQAELEGAYNELLQLAAARRARLDESHKLQTFYRDAEEEEMWVSEKAHSLQSTDYGHDLNSAMVLLNKHEVWGCKHPLTSCMENFLDNTRVSWMQMVGYAVVDWQGWFAYVLFNVHLSCRNKGWRLIDLPSGANLVVGANASKKNLLWEVFISLSICYKSDNFKSL